MSMNMIIQYTIVAIIIAAACIWMLTRILSKKNNGKSCCGCSLADTCSPDRKERHQTLKKEQAKKAAPSEEGDGCGCGSEKK